VIGRHFRKDATMRSYFSVIALAVALSGCQTAMRDEPARGLSAVNVPVVTRSDFAFDMQMQDGFVSPGEAARLDAWFRSMQLGYGDSVHLDGPYAMSALGDVQRIAGAYGMLVQPGAPVTAGAIPPGVARVVVSRTVAFVPGCPNWNRQANPNYSNRMMPNFGCAVNSAYAAMVANPEDLIHGQEGSGVADATTAARAVKVYRSAPPTGTGGLQDISTKKDK